MDKKNKIIAHRGLFDNNKIPENSKKAIREALKKQLPIEIDVQLTTDNTLVVFHDYDLKRMTNQKGLIQNLTYSDIKNYSLLDTNEKIPTLKEVLELVQDKVLLDIEIKNTKRIKETCNELLKLLEPYHNYILKSFNPRIVHYLKKRNSLLKVGYLIGTKKIYPNKLVYFLLTNSLTIMYCQPDFLAISKKLWPKKKYKRKAQKYPIYLWTIKKREEITDSSLTYICENIPTISNH